MLESRLRALLCDARDYARQQGIDAEFNLHRERSSLIRLGNSAVALSTYEDLTRVGVRVYDGRRTGGVSLTADVTAPEQLREALHRARESCAAALPLDYDPIFGVVEEDIDAQDGWDPALAELAPQAKTALCAEVVESLAPLGNFSFSGSWSSGSTERYLVTTANDREAYHRLSDGKLVLVLQDQAGKWELSVEQSGSSAADFSAAHAVAEFRDLLPIYQANGGYRTALGGARVIFGPQAIAELVTLAIWGGFQGRSFEEQRAYTSGKAFGETLFSPLVTLSDDPIDDRVFRTPFDGKGRVRRRFPLVENGVFRGVMYDSATAARYGKAPTGHDVSSVDAVFATGEANAGLAEARRLAGDALYIPHLHYTHLPNPAQGMFTGSSRFNALRVAGGEFVAPLFSTRITDTIPNVLTNVLAVSSRAVQANISQTYDARSPEAVSVPEYLICDNVRITDVASGF